MSEDTHVRDTTAWVLRNPALTGGTIESPDQGIGVCQCLRMQLPSASLEMFSFAGYFLIRHGNQSITTNWLLQNRS
jgi:hypothetical protein